MTNFDDKFEHMLAVQDEVLEAMVAREGEEYTALARKTANVLSVLRFVARTSNPALTEYLTEACANVLAMGIMQTAQAKQILISEIDIKFTQKFSDNVILLSNQQLSS